MHPDSELSAPNRRLLGRWSENYLKPAYRQVRSVERRLLKRWEGELLLRARFRRTFNRKLNYKNPRTFTEKLFCRMISTNRYGNPLFTRLTDKYSARDYIRERVGDQHLVKLIWYGSDSKEIPFAQVPKRCVIKTNHSCGGVVIVDGSVDQMQVTEHLEKALATNYYWYAREYQYYEIIPKILIEELIDDGQPSGPLDFRVWCFNGIPKLIQLDNSVHSIDVWYDVDWNLLNLTDVLKRREHCEIAKPRNFEEMMAVSTALAQGIDFVRVDLYSANGKVYVGELTFTPKSGNIQFEPQEWDAILGDAWVLTN